MELAFQRTSPDICHQQVKSILHGFSMQNSFAFAVVTFHSSPLSLDELQKFIQATVEGLDRSVAKGNHCGLVDIMSHLLAVRDRQTSTDKMFEPLRDTVVLLEQYGVTIPEQVYSQLEVQKIEVPYSEVMW